MRTVKTLRYTLHDTQFDDRLWRALVVARWGPITPLMQRAAHHAGSFQALYADKACCERAQAPWQTLCASERAAAISQLCGESGDQNVLVLFLVDGSGSVTQGLRRHSVVERFFYAVSNR